MASHNKYFWTVILSILLQIFLTSPRSINTTSSPRFPQNNGKAERAVCTIKNLLSKSKDFYAALLAYRSTPIQCGYSPTKLLMSRQLHSSVPIASSQLKQAIADYSVLKEEEKKR